MASASWLSDIDVSVNIAASSVASGRRNAHHAVTSHLSSTARPSAMSPSKYSSSVATKSASLAEASNIVARDEYCFIGCCQRRRPAPRRGIGMRELMNGLAFESEDDAGGIFYIWSVKCGALITTLACCRPKRNNTPFDIVSWASRKLS